MINIGAQNFYPAKSGAYTGEISFSFFEDFGLGFVLVGHSERRHIFGECQKFLNKKLDYALSNFSGKVVYCIGETFEERQNGQKDAVITKQIRNALEGVVIGPRNQIIIAYEPVWVIGSGQAVDPEEAQHIARVIREEVFDIYKDHEDAVDDYLRILYGGSVNSKNIKDFIAGDISGVLVGSASLNIDELNKMLKIIDTK